MGDAGPKPMPFGLLPWVAWLLGAVVVLQAWAFVDNVRERDWFLAGCFGVCMLAFVVQIVALLRIRSRAKSRSAADRRA